MPQLASPPRPTASSRRCAFLAALLASAALAGCADGANPVRDLAVASGVTGGEPKPAPDFVTRTRPASVDYMPIGVSAPKRRYRAKKEDAVKSVESQMDAARGHNDQRGAAARKAGAAAAASPAVPPKAPPPPQ